MNISFVTGKDFKRDALLIRDLVSACGKMNLVFSENQIPIYIYTAIRSEVIDSVESSVRELQKWIDDKGVHLNWISALNNKNEQPFIQLLRQRIHANEIRLSGKMKEVPKTNLNRYFEPKINKRDFEKFLVFETWGRPRDLVRILQLAARYVDRGRRFSTDSFVKSENEYSSSCWNEKRDELNSKYSQSEIETIKRLLTGSKANFSKFQIDEHFSYSARNDPRTNQFLTGRNTETLLEDLFKVGVLGNLIKSPKGKYYPNYHYTGLTNFTTSEIICIHRSLWKVLNINPRNGAMAEGIKQQRKQRR